MEFGEPRRHHVGDVYVADAACRGFVDELALALDPLPVASGSLVPQRFDGRRPRLVLAIPTEREHHLVARLVHQPLARGDVMAQRCPLIATSRSPVRTSMPGPSS